MPTYISKHRHFIRSNSDLAGPSGRRRRSAAARLLGLWVRIPPEAWMFVCSECCVLSGRGLCDELIIRPEESYRLWCVFVCDLETSWMRRPWPTGGAVAPKTNKINSDLNLNFFISTVLCIHVLYIQRVLLIPCCNLVYHKKTLAVIFASYQYTPLIGGNK